MPLLLHVRKAQGDSEAKMKTRWRIRDRVKQFYKSLDKGACRVTPKDLQELLASDFPDSSDTDGFRSVTREAASADSESSDDA